VSETFWLISFLLDAVEKLRAHLEEQNLPDEYFVSGVIAHFSQGTGEYEYSSLSPYRNLLPYFAAHDELQNLTYDLRTIKSLLHCSHIFSNVL